jgi:hypothetical protein
VQNGIDQGDTISPILWRIYYDPLISKISRESGYRCLNKTYDFTQLKNTRHWTNISVAAYMDDTAWISDNKTSMEKTLQTATSFFKMSHIQANPQKSFLFTLGEKHESTITFNNTNIRKTNIPIRYLGVWIEDKQGKKYQRQLIQQITSSLLNKLTWKRTTDKQIAYLTNHVIFPKIEYLLNDLVLDEKETEKINRKVRHVVKHKTGFATSSPNSMMHNKLSYGIFDIQSRQIQKHLTDLETHYSAKNLVGQLTRENIDNLQWLSWSNKSILHSCPKMFKNNHFFIQDVLRNAQNLQIRIQKKDDPPHKQPRKDLQTIEELMKQQWFNLH